jgi:hypothetical protein
VAHVDAIVPDKIVRVNGRGMLSHVLGRGDRHKTPIRSDPNSDHVFLDALAKTDSGIETLH